MTSPASHPIAALVIPEALSTGTVVVVETNYSTFEAEGWMGKIINCSEVGARERGGTRSGGTLAERAGSEQDAPPPPPESAAARWLP